jgi:hypothetical protein
LADEPAISSVLHEAGMNAAALASSLHKLRSLLDRTQHEEELSQISPTVIRVDLLKDGLRVKLKLASLLSRSTDTSSDAHFTVTWVVPLQLNSVGWNYDL